MLWACVAASVTGDSAYLAGTSLPFSPGPSVYTNDSGNKVRLLHRMRKPPGISSPRVHLSSRPVSRYGEPGGAGAGGTRLPHAVPAGLP